MRQERQEFESNVDSRIIYMENLLGKVAGVQQAQLERLVDLTTGAKSCDHTPSASGASSATSTVTVAADQKALDLSASGPIPEPAKSAFNFTNLSDSAVPESDEDWKNYHGLSAWHFENEKKKKNPFDHQAYLKKGEKIATFQDLMTTTFKTLGKLVEMGCELKGLISHGRFMAEKASKDVFIDEAFVSYDEGVRKRAGDSGPSAFGVVLQEEVFLHFCYENTKKQRNQAKLQGKGQKPKSDKICLRYNDGGCTSKSCGYAHKCQTCEGWGHSKRKCENANKKKEGK